MANKVFIMKGDLCQEVKPDAVPGLKVIFTGKSDGNTVTISEPFLFEKTVMQISGNNNTVEIGPNCEIRTVSFVLAFPANDRKVIIGKNFSFVGGFFYVPHNNNILSIGDNCMFSAETVISTDDGHPIFDMYTKQILNKGGTVTIADNVWLDYAVTVNKNVRICDHTIIGACSVVTRDIAENYSVYAGCPARLVKKNVDFSRLSINEFRKGKK